MTAVWLLAGLFAGWLVLAIYRTLMLVRAKRGDRKHLDSPDTQRVAILLRDRVGQVEWFVRRVVAELELRPDLKIVLVDGGSTDGTMQMLERMAHHFDLGFRRLAELNSGCRRAANANNANIELRITCRSKICFNQGRRLNYVNSPAVCLDLRGVSANELLRYSLF